MKAQLIRALGGPEVLELTDVPTPEPGAGEVLVRQHATSVNPVDYKIRQAGLGSTPPFPVQLGCDVCGEVAAIGEGVDDFAVGDLVYGAPVGVPGRAGAYAEYVVAEARLLARRPQSISARDAATLPLVSITALEGLERAGAGEGKTVVIRGGTGGVGHIAVQLAKAMGARVIATAGSDGDVEIAKGLGADEVVRYDIQNWVEAILELTGGQGAEIVFDTTGRDDLATCFDATALNGHVVSTVSLFTSDLTMMHLRGLSLHIVFMLLPMMTGISGLAHRRILDRVTTLVDAGSLRPRIDPTAFTLDQVAAAHRLAESGQAKGKIAVTIAAEG